MENGGGGSCLVLGFAGVPRTLATAGEESVSLIGCGVDVFPDARPRSDRRVAQVWLVEKERNRDAMNCWPVPEQSQSGRRGKLYSGVCLHPSAPRSGCWTTHRGSGCRVLEAGIGRIVVESLRRCPVPPFFMPSCGQLHLSIAASGRNP